jgi:hemoglobin-like flavoprotein
MFTRLFEKNPDLINLFEKFKKIPQNNLYKSTVFLDHVNAAMEEIDKVITDLDNGEVSQKCIKKIGADHKARGIKSEFFTVIL